MAADLKIVLVKRQTRLEQLIAQYNTEAQVRFVIESRGGDVRDYYQEHQVYMEAIYSVQMELHEQARIHVLDRQFLFNYQFGAQDIIVVVGQDGLVANTLKYLQSQPVIAINPDPDRFDGVLLPFKIGDAHRAVSAVNANDFAINAITMAQMTLNDGQRLLAVNDFYIGPRFPISAQYKLYWGEKSEEQSSSGILVSTGLGSSGWLKSVMTGASAVMGLTTTAEDLFGWDSDFLRFVVREPFPSRKTGTSLISGKVTQQKHLSIESRMPNHGVIFSDGMYDDFIEFNSGAIADIAMAPHKANLVASI